MIAGRELTLWTGLLAGPLAFLTLLEVNYVLACVACEAQQKWFLHLATAVAVVLVAAAGARGWYHGPPKTISAARSR